ncbi:MAG TPA: DUF1553 domain-containing protein [Planctomicrobium sp.]|nr:DUF1553 domain-containing protein [Planctomicrobium sp.]
MSTQVGYWDFSTSPPAGLEPGGDVVFLQSGPRPPVFPTFQSGNKAVWLDGKGAALKVIGGGANSDFQFDNGDAISIESWVKVDRLDPNQPVYIIGKGRSGRSQFQYGNQNWSLRLTNIGSSARLDFLFTTQLDGEKPTWHRWRSVKGFPVTSDWHYLAISYRFGDPDSIKGWIDGVSTSGNWDLTGPTRNPPVVDTDDVWIGSSMNRSPGSSLHGAIDEVSVHRKLLDDDVISGKFRREGKAKLAVPQKEEMPTLENLPTGKVQFSLSERLPAHDRWLNEGETFSPPLITWTGDEFLLPRIPARFDDWGIRTKWNAPLLLRIAADVELPAGTQKLLVRGRGLSRLWIDGEVITRTLADTIRLDGGRNPIVPPATPPLPGLRRVGGNMQEVTAETTLQETDNGKHRVVLELIVGGPRVRTETGEVCVAVQTENGQSYQILTPQLNSTFPLTDLAVESALSRIEQSLIKLDDTVRRNAASSQDSFWEQRHALALEWVKQQPALPIPRQTENVHPIDAFITAKIERARQAEQNADPAVTDHFYRNVLPILQENCFRCHGEKDQGGLKLNSREHLLKAGDSEVPAVVPGDTESSELIARIRETDESLRMPPTGKGLSPEQVKTLEKWVQSGANWPSPRIDEKELTPAPLTSDEQFLRRIYLDLVGVPPTVNEAQKFLLDSAPDKRTRLIDQLLADDRVADHWVSYWQDVLAENPSIILATLNSTGPFRWFLHDSLKDHKPLDQLVTELILMKGSVQEGGSAGFGIAAENDSPFAAKGHILASAFLGIETQCARCHDSPYHSTLQKDLYSLAAMLNRKSVTVPKSSRVPAEFFEKQARESLIKVTLKPNEVIPPVWPFAGVTGVDDNEAIDRLMRKPDDSRERLAALMTAPDNKRFTLVVVNRIWKQLLGTGLVEPVHDWEGRSSSHPELHEWLAREWIHQGYDLPALIRLITTSDLYQRQAVGRNLAVSPELRFFQAPDRRRLSAEQVVDSLHSVTGCRMESEPLTFDPEGRDNSGQRPTLGLPLRAWMMADLKNERDRPSLSLPQARTIADVLEAFGWTGSRQQPINQRETDPNVLQPGVLANGILPLNLTSASAGSSLAELALNAESAESLVETLYLQILCRHPLPEERTALLTTLTPGFQERRVPVDQVKPVQWDKPLPQVTWFNHVKAEANDIQLEKEQRVRQGHPADPRLQPEWRERFEDAVWSLINDREFVWIP